MWSDTLSTTTEEKEKNKPFVKKTRESEEERHTYELSMNTMRRTLQKKHTIFFCYIFSNKFISFFLYWRGWFGSCLLPEVLKDKKYIKTSEKMKMKWNEDTILFLDWIGCHIKGEREILDLWF